MKKVVFIYNPRSGNGNIVRHLNYIVKKCTEKNIILLTYMIGATKNDFYIDIIKKEKPNAVIIAGGDGTASRIAGVLKEKGMNIPIGIIPAGTCNDMSRVLVSDEFGKCVSVDTLIDKFLDFDVRTIDVGLVNDRMFINTLAGGMIAGVSTNTNQDFKKNIGKLAYYITTLVEMGNIKPFQLSVKWDEGSVDGEFIFFMVLNGKHAGGLNNVIPNAQIDDGYLDVMLVKSCLPMEMLSILISATQGKMEYNKNVITFKTKNIEFMGAKEILTTIDGERGIPLPLKVSCLENYLDVLK